MQNDDKPGQVVAVQGNSQNLPMSAKQLQQQIALVQEVVNGVMKDEVHYGNIPGTQGKALFKAGAEMLLATFRIAIEPEVHMMDVPEGEIGYRVFCRGIHIGSGMPVGTGLGECSTLEEKFRWQAALCDEQYNEAEPEARRRKWVKDFQNNQYRGVKAIDQVRRDPGDVANTILKMAKKRAEVDLCLTALAVSDLFMQPRGNGNGGNKPRYQDRKRTPPPQAAAEPEKDVSDFKIGDAQFRIIRARLQGADMEEQDLLDAFSKKELSDFTFDDFSKVLEYIADHGKG